MKNYVAYYRVSTKKQNNSGLGLEAQKSCINDYMKANKGILVKEFTEIESGKKDKRIELEKALNHCKKFNATLIIAKLDRLSRNISFIFALRDSKVDFVCCDLPEANTLTIGIFATLAQYERELISERTKKALAEKKKQGAKLGKNNLTDKIRKMGNKAVHERSIEKNEQVIKLIEMFRVEGQTYRAIANNLNNLGFKTVKGNAFFANSVRQLLLSKNRNLIQ